METLIADIEAFCADHGLTENQFGLAALNDKNFVQDLRAGRDIRFSTSSKVLNFMATYQPAQGEAA